MISYSCTPNYHIVTIIYFAVTTSIRITIQSLNSKK